MFGRAVKMSEIPTCSISVPSSTLAPLRLTQLPADVQPRRQQGMTPKVLSSCHPYWENQIEL